jgi:hypothetical protein
METTSSLKELAPIIAQILLIRSVMNIKISRYNNFYIIFIYLHFFAIVVLCYHIYIYTLWHEAWQNTGPEKQRFLGNGCVNVNNTRAIAKQRMHATMK